MRRGVTPYLIAGAAVLLMTAVRWLLASILGEQLPFMSGYTDDVVIRRGLLESGVPFLRSRCPPWSLPGRCDRCSMAERCEQPHSPRLPTTTYISSPCRAGVVTLRAGVAIGVIVHPELKAVALRGGPPQGVEAWLIVKGADLAVEAAAKVAVVVGAEEVVAVAADGVAADRVAADRVAADRRVAVVVAVVDPEDLEVAV